MPKVKKLDVNKVQAIVPADKPKPRRKSLQTARSKGIIDNTSGAVVDKTEYRQRAFEDFSDDGSIDSVVEAERISASKVMSTSNPDIASPRKEGEITFSKWKNYTDIFNNLT